MAAFLSATVGLVFLATAALKAIDARTFGRHLMEYRLIPKTRVWKASLAFIGLEFAIGVGLLLALSSLLLPAAILLLVMLSGLTIWASINDRAENCGCYGGALMLTPRQSVVLNCGYIALLGASWWLWDPATESGYYWKVVLMAAAAAAGIAVAIASFRRGALLDFSPLRVNRRWNKNWLPEGAPDVAHGSWFVVFLSKDCPYCKEWLPFLNVIEVQPESPKVVGIAAMTGAEREQFSREHMIHFPVVTVVRRLLSIFADSYPTAALVKDGVIQEKWVGKLPEPFVEQVRRFFESLQMSAKPAAKAFRG